jgi:type 1 glutamine amidotransferase
MRTRIRVSIVLLASVLACAQDPTPTAPGRTSGPAAVHVLMVTATAGFRHDSIATAQQVMRRLAGDASMSLTVTEDLALLDAATLSGYDVLFFALTSGELPLSAAQKEAMLDFVAGGKGFIGVHSATDTLYTWPEYGAMVGAYFSAHPWTERATVIVEDRSHPSTAGLDAQFDLLEEFYTFRENPRPRVQVLLRLDPTSVRASGDYPLAWARAFGAGRVYYNALGHFPETWEDTRFQQQIVGAMRWAAGR